MTAPFVSFAQNFEDVMLWRALKGVVDGFYIDIGAFDPKQDSVTAAFYERGWHGINVEPNVHLWREFLEARPRDTSLNVAIGDTTGERTIYLVSNPGLSTLSAGAARDRARDGYGVVPHAIQMETLASLARAQVPPDQPVHFLKVDVEGFEREVLLGADWVRLRPWIVVVEATLPMSTEAVHGVWEDILLGADYAFAYDDGLNRFYVAAERRELLDAFRHPPNVFDGFVRASERTAVERARRSEAGIARLEGQLSAMESSGSWRRTALFRTIGRRLRSGRKATSRRLRRIGSNAAARTASLMAKGESSTASVDSLIGDPARSRRTSGKDRPRLLVEVSNIVQSDSHSGIPRVVRSLLSQLPGELPGHDVTPVFATAGQNGYRLAPSIREGGVSRRELNSSEAIEIRATDTFLGLDFRPEVVVAQSDFFDELRAVGARTFFVVYDLLPLTLPHRFRREAAENHRRWLEVVARSDGAFCISQTTARELQNWLDSYDGPTGSRPRVAIFPLGADFERSATKGFPPDSGIVLRELARRPTFLMVGTLEARKGHEQALDAFEFLWSAGEDVGLAFVGKQGWLVSRLLSRINAHDQLGTRLHWLQGISDEFLEKIYEASSCLLLPSEGEGFGLPVIEALRHGTPVLARDLPVTREVAGDAATYFDGSDAASLADAVREWLNSSHRWKVEPPNWIKAYTWKASAAALARLTFAGEEPNGHVKTSSEQAVTV